MGDDVSTICWVCAQVWYKYGKKLSPPAETWVAGAASGEEAVVVGSKNAELGLLAPSMCSEAL